MSEFASDFLEPLLEKRFFAKKEVNLLVEFNTNPLNCNMDKNTFNCVDILYSHAFYPMITVQHKLVPTQKILIDDVFYIFILYYH